MNATTSYELSLAKYPCAIRARSLAPKMTIFLLTSANYDDVTGRPRETRQTDAQRKSPVLLESAPRSRSLTTYGMRRSVEPDKSHAKPTASVMPLLS